MKNIFLGLVLALVGFGCAQDKQTAYTTTATPQYTYMNGSCYDYANMVYVASSYCSSTTASTGYVYNNGYCYSTTTGQYVDSSYCSTTTTGTTNTGYVYYNGYCYSTTTGQYVSTAYCSTTGTTGTTVGGTGGTCYGTYIYSQGGYYQYVQCSGYNCRGYMLIQANTGQTVYCQ
ncbi:hypothetical protein [Pseudobdellovibrio exovorus]|uniref:Lipoprotein n=1 Tax=Pseudobdellovibrio exovorus JSS TaxID=1184267 RepID=M4V6M9_9BACT|nr:hypothetical protein [Pseudobdellovibrio exovorus]AGH94863.1 hypothetical protein A11Q_643 [Pseudobdellovibrio exovorus JSS]